MWETHVHDTQSGARLATVEVTDNSWSRGDQQMHTTSVPLTGQFSRAEWRYLFGRVRDRVLMTTWNGRPVYAGLLINPGRYNPNTGILDVQSADPYELADGRWLFGVGTSNGEGGYKPAGQTVFTNRSRRGIVRELFRIIFTDATISPAWPIRLNLPAPEAGSLSLTVDHYNFESGDSLIMDQVEAEGGPDFDLQPRLDGTVMSWDLRLGNPYLTGSRIDINLMAPWNAAIDPVWEINGEEKLTGIHYPGKGSEQKMRVGAAFEPVSAGLAKDGRFEDKNIESVTELSARARGHLNAVRNPVSQWSTKVNVRDVDPSALRIGSTVAFNTAGDGWIPDGWSASRLIGFSGDMSDVMSLELEEA